ncbi:bifunctional phosphoglucose/phosphomannose isomerase [Pontibacter locisalis]|uniref:Bifunctional phosphoglucose/phosphomannose isomerase n=1 Tax=Pontibacter locisalis TaxID=1719035 RepID=A0ABW5IIU1_9BACT
MKQLIEGFVQQLRRAVELGKSSTLTFPAVKYKNVVIAGMGASGVAANLVQTYVADKIRVPVLVRKNYVSPAFVDSETLYIAASFSGNTEEVIAGLKAAIDSKATVCFITSGGELLHIAHQNELPLILLPASSELSRAHFMYSFVQMLYMLYYAGLLRDDFKVELEQSISLLEEQAGSIKVQASALASALAGKLPAIYAGNLFEPVALRLQQQINTNSKQLCHVNVFPEMSHNEIEGFQHPEQLLKHLVILLIKSDYDHPRVHLGMDFCKKVFAQKVENVLEIKALGATFLEQVFYLVHMFDWISVYLAELNDVDTNATDNIDYLRNKFSEE